MARYLLWVDDDAAVRKAMTRSFLRRGVPSDLIRQAANTLAAREILKTAAPEDRFWVASDHDMPGGNGLDFLRELPALLGDRLGGRALLTGGHSELREAVEAEGILFLDKPVDQTEFAALCERIVNFLNGS